MPPDKERIAALEANQANMKATQEAIFDYLKEGRIWREETSKSLVVVVNNQIDMKQYQDRCDKERTDHDKRITEVEGFQKRQMKIALGAGGVAGFLVMGGTKVFEKVLGLFS